jgi:hypothetical protein
MFFEYEDDDEDDSSDRAAAPPAPFFSGIRSNDLGHRSRRLRRRTREGSHSRPAPPSTVVVAVGVDRFSPFPVDDYGGDYGSRVPSAIPFSLSSQSHSPATPSPSVGRPCHPWSDPLCDTSQRNRNAPVLRGCDFGRRRGAMRVSAASSECSPSAHLGRLGDIALQTEGSPGCRDSPVWPTLVCGGRRTCIGGSGRLCFVPSVRMECAGHACESGSGAPVPKGGWA